jgi:hypothetical protein
MKMHFKTVYNIFAYMIFLYIHHLLKKGGTKIQPNRREIYTL